MTKLLAAGVLALAIIAVGANTEEMRAEETDETVAQGRSLVEANCSRCHAIGKDDTSHHPEAPPFRVVVTRYPPENLAEALAEGIVSGHPDMPEFVFEPPEINAIIAYLGTLAPSPSSPPK